MTSKDPRTADPFSPMHVDENEDAKSNHGMVPSSPPFQKDQRVWAQDPVTSRYHRATIRDLRWEATEWKFRVHYQGWNSRWDRWLVANHIAEENQTENLRAAGLLTHGKETTETKEEDDDAENEEVIVNAAASGRKRKSDVAEPSKATSVSSRKRRTTKNRKTLPYADYCELPITLQTVLVEEWERLTRPIQHTGKPPSRLVHSLPASVTIHQVLKHFAKKQKQEAASSGGSAENAAKNPSDVDDFCSSLSQLFQTSMPKCLLYNQERPQYEALLRDPQLSGKPLTDIYGCEYLFAPQRRRVCIDFDRGATLVRIIDFDAKKSPSLFQGGLSASPAKRMARE